MGWKYEVWVWKSEGIRWDWELVYGGQSLLKALLAAHKEKRYCGSAIKVEWR